MMSVMAYPISVRVEPAPSSRNRLTVAFRLVLAIPHILIVGAIGFGFAANRSSNDAASFSGESGVLGAVAITLAIVSWFTILFAGDHFTPIRQFTRFYLRWRVRSLAYLMLLSDVYPPFGDGTYPAAMTCDERDQPRNRLTVAFRIVAALPHFVVLACVIGIWWITTIISWFVILITGQAPQALLTFGAGALQWLIRVEAYVLLLVDDYPPFSLN